MKKGFAATHSGFRFAKVRLTASISALILAIFLPFTAATQMAAEPEREQLLNGLTILLWPQPGNQNVTLRLRINSGAAFDLAGKDGLMSLLGDALFPDPTTQEYVAEQLGGKLSVVTTHDLIEVTISGKASEFERMVELLRNALLATQLTAENVTRLREDRIKQLSVRTPSAADIADRAVLQRLFGSFPYAHPTEGSAETMGRIDRADLMLARERFLNADNAVIAVSGGVEKARAMRALRQLLGSWNKGDRLVPTTFRQPDPANPRVLLINHPAANNAEVRLAVRGLARADRDSVLATSILTRIVRDRWQAAAPELSSVKVRHEAHMLPGIFVLSATCSISSAQKGLTAARQALLALAQSGPTAVEVERARADALADLQRMSEAEAVIDNSLDVITFKSSSSDRLVDSLNRVTPADVQRVAARLFRDIVSIVVGDTHQLRSTFTDAVEVRDKTGGNMAAGDSPPTKKP